MDAGLCAATAGTPSVTDLQPAKNRRSTTKEQRTAIRYGRTAIWGSVIIRKTLTYIYKNVVPGPTCVGTYYGWMPPIIR